MNLHMTREWLLKMAEKEGNGIVSVGGLAARVEAISQPPASPATERGALGQLVEWQRRKDALERRDSGRTCERRSG